MSYGSRMLGAGRRLGKPGPGYFQKAEPQVQEPGFSQDEVSYEWQWTVSDLVNAAIRAGLVIEELGEYPVAAYEFMSGLVVAS